MPLPPAPTKRAAFLSPDALDAPARTSHNIRCPEHPIAFMPCPQCAAKRCLPDPVEHGDYLEAKKALAGARPVAATTRAPQLTDAESAAIARRRLEQETNR